MSSDEPIEDLIARSSLGSRGARLLRSRTTATERRRVRDLQLFLSRFQEAADLMGHGQAGLRLAGVNMMAKLADDWADQRQQCIDVLCAHLRLPNPEVSEPEEQEVRLAVIRLITAHLQSTAPSSWQGHDLDLTGAVFEGGDFRGTQLSGNVDFSGAEFSGNVDFSGAKFSGNISFSGTRLSGNVDFTGAEFSGNVDFSDAKFSGTVDFGSAKFAGGNVDFTGAEFSGTIVFHHRDADTGDVPAMIGLADLLILRGKEDEAERWYRKAANTRTVIRMVEGARDGDKEAWDELVERYAPLVWSVARRFRLSSDDVDDVGQTVWLLLIERLPELREPATLPGWIATTTQRECLRLMRLRRRTEPTDPADVPPDPSNVVRPVDEELLAHERREAVREGFARLAPRCQSLLSMLVSDPPASYTEISQKLNMPIGSIGPNRARCLGRLRQTPALAELIGTQQNQTV